MWSGLLPEPEPLSGNIRVYVMLKHAPEPYRESGSTSAHSWLPQSGAIFCFVKRIRGRKGHGRQREFSNCGKGKGKKGTGKGKHGKSNPNPSPSASRYFHGECGYCKNLGHKRGDCRKRTEYESGKSSAPRERTTERGSCNSFL